MADRRIKLGSGRNETLFLYKNQKKSYIGGDFSNTIVLRQLPLKVSHMRLLIANKIRNLHKSVIAG